MGFISHHEKEWESRGDGVWAVIVGEFCMGYRFCPQGGIISTEDLEVDFNVLVDPFGFSIRLGVIGGGKGEIVIKESSSLLGEG